MTVAGLTVCTGTLSLNFYATPPWRGSVMAGAGRAKNASASGPGYWLFATQGEARPQGTASGPGYVLRAGFVGVTTTGQ
jgi:hypothetical protein